MSDVMQSARDWVRRLGLHGLAASGDQIAKLMRPGGVADPWPIYRKIRDRGVYRGRIGYAVASHELCTRVLRGTGFGMRDSAGKPAGGEPAVGAAPSLLDLDPPDHSRLRRLVAPAFRPRLIADYRPQIEKTTARLLDDAVSSGTSFDLIAGLASPLPIAVISDLLGVPEDRRGAFARYGTLVGQALDGRPTPAQRRELEVAGAELKELFTDLMDRRRTEPGADVISVLVSAVDAGKVTPDELISTCELLLIAGFETTTNLIGNGVFQLRQHPEQWELLRDSPDLAAKAVEEVLRYDPPVPFTGRVAHADIELAGEPVKRDSLVLTILATANRDSAVYPRPDDFDITRDGGPEHFAFSSGIHYCLGAQLARIEGEIALRTLAERFPRLDLAGEPTHRPSSSIRGFLHLPVAA